MKQLGKSKSGSVVLSRQSQRKRGAGGFPQGIPRRGAHVGPPTGAAGRGRKEMTAAPITARGTSVEELYGSEEGRVLKLTVDEEHRSYFFITSLFQISYLISYFVLFF